MPDIFDKYSKDRPELKPIIYAYSDTRWPGYLKIGYTTRTVEERMKEHYPTLTPTISYKVEYVESALYPNGTVFMDHDVHRVLRQKGFRIIKDSSGEKNTEWFQCSVNDVKAAIIAVKTHTLNAENRTQTFGLRPEQKSAIQMTRRYFLKEKEMRPDSSPTFLWNCKMRFGKTFTSYKLAQSMGLKNILILTFKPAVEDSWENDLLSHVDFEGWQFYSRKAATTMSLTPDKLDKSRPIVCFGSFQDFLGTNENGGIKAKNEWVHTMNWDIVIFDEYHFGAWRDSAKKLFSGGSEDEYDSLDIEKYKQDEADNAINESFLPITSDYYLYLSGTPFRSINTGEFLEDQIYSWTYSDEQKAKEEWPTIHPDQPNPYASLPRMVMMTYKMPEELERVAKGGEFDEFDLNVFFSASSKNGLEEAEFVYKREVQAWLDMIRGGYMPMAIDDLHRSRTDRPVMPFSDVRMLNTLTHTLWFLPNVASCYAMRNLLAEKQNVFYHDYTVNLCAGQRAGIGLAAVDPVRNSMDPALETKTITLSCGKLTTGVTIRPWTGIFMLRNLSSPETYFQAAFRVQSPWTIKKEDGTEEIIKENCYVFDFAVNRSLRQIADYSCRLNVHESNPEVKVGEFIKFLPVLAFDGSAMTAIDAGSILDIVTAGTSASLLARRWESALLVNVDNATLERILNDKEALDALMSIESFRTLNTDIETIINKSNHVKKAKTTDVELTPKEKKQISDEEKEYKSQRKKLQEKLIKLAARIPIFMYLTDFREYSLQDIIRKLEPGLFQKVTGLTLRQFEKLLSIGVFNDALMNDAIFKFKRYEDNSLEYTGITMHSPTENVGLFNTVITAEEYEELSRLQGASMEKPDFVIQIPGPAPKTRTASKSPAKPATATTLPPTLVPKPAPKAEAKAKVTPRVGMVVIHNKFGEGIITKVETSDRFTVKFAVIGEKRLGTMVFTNGIVKVKEN